MADASVEGDYERFFAVAKRSLMGQAFLLTGDVEDARDLVQEVLLRAWRDWPHVSTYDDPHGWARRVLHNLAIGRWRHEQRRHRFQLREDRGASSPPDVGHLDIVEALRRLPAKQLRALVLHDVVGLSVIEVASEIEVPKGTVRSWLSRGRAALAADLGLDPARAGGPAE